MKPILTAILALLLLSSTAQEKLYDYATLPDKQFFKKSFLGSTVVEDFKKGVRTGEATREELSIKKIGLISFYQLEIELKKDKARSFAYGYTNANSNTVIQQIYDSSIEVIKDSLRSNGVDLILPDQYLNNENRTFYEDALAQIKNLGIKKVDLYTAFEEIDRRCTPDGIDFVGTMLDMGRNDEVLSILGKLAEKLGLDGFLTTKIVTQYYNFALAFHSASFQVYIPHPLPNAKRDIYGYNLGQYDYIMDAPRGFVGIKKEEVIGEDYSGFAPILSRSAGDFADFLNSEIKYLFGE